jgi:hypothetical protein
MSLSHSDSIQVVTKDAKFSRGLPSSISSSLMIWYAASFGIDLSGIRYLQEPNPVSTIPGKAYEFRASRRSSPRQLLAHVARREGARHGGGPVLG